MTEFEKARFRRTVYGIYKKHRREFPWRETHDPYRILISEVMLQQTQAGPRTTQKYKDFLERFPCLLDLTHASLRDVLSLWKGLGYNRRAKALRDAADLIVKRHGGEVPDDIRCLEALPGVGPYTAAAISVFAFHKPAILLETNIRTVFLHTFFSRRRRPVSDSEIVPLIEKTLDNNDLREWYFALMDYGAFLKKTHRGLNRRSRHYARQGQFRGSDREIRGKILKVLLKDQELTRAHIAQKVDAEPVRVARLLRDLVRERMLVREKQMYSL